jgi:hypothetical protein
LAAAKQLAGKPWHNLSEDDTAKAIVLQATGLLGPHMRQPGADNGHLRCQVGSYTGPH